MNHIECSVIIPTYKDDGQLNRCLKALDDQSIQKENFEVIVVNNFPEKELCLDSFPGLKLMILAEEKPGSYAARNKGIEYTSGDIISFTDSDCIPDKNWIKNALEIFNDDDIQLIAGEVDIYDATGNEGISYTYERHVAFNQKKNAEKGISVTANLFIRKSILKDLSGFNDTLMSGGDAEFTRSATQKGYNLIYGENVRVSHPSRKNIREILKKEIRVSAGLFVRNKSPLKLKLLFKSFALIGYSPFISAKIVKANYKDCLVVVFITFLRHIIRFIVQFGLTIQILNPDRFR